MTYVTDTSQILTAFPAYMRNDVEAVIRLMPDTEVWYTPDIVIVRDEKLTIPHRVITTPHLHSKLSPDQQAVYWCILSRSTDGYAREQAVRQLIDFPLSYDWVVPYLFLSLSDRVVEVSSIVAASKYDSNVYIPFISKNQRICEQTLARCISYWNEYYRPRYPQLKDYPPYHTVRALQKLINT